MQGQARPGPGSVSGEVCFGALRASAQTRHLGRDRPESFVPRAFTTQCWALQCSSVRLSFLLRWSAVRRHGCWCCTHPGGWLVLQARRVCLFHTHAQHGTNCACLLVCGAHARVSQGVVAAAVSLGLPVPAVVIDFQGHLIRITVPVASQRWDLHQRTHPRHGVQHVSASAPCPTEEGGDTADCDRPGCNCCTWDVQ